MSYTPIAHGTPDWDVPLNAALSDQDSRITDNTTVINNNSASITSLQSQVTTNLDNLVYLVDNHGAVGDGVTNDQPAIQALINSVPTGATIQFGPKKYLINSPITPKPFMTLAGPHGNRTDNVQTAATIKVGGSFSGLGAILLVDKEQGGFSTDNEGIRLERLTIDGSSAPATVDGIRATGLVHGVVLDRVAIQSMTNRGINCQTYTRADTSVVHPYSWNLWNCMVWQCSDRGFSFSNQQTDCTFVNCEALGNGGDGFTLTSCNNSQLTSCRSEWNLRGYYITGSWGTGQGSGGVIMTGCSTDRNTQDGVLIDSTGNATHLVAGLMTRRDGRNAGSGGGGYAALKVSSATTPVIVSGISCYPGTDDDGSGTNSPERGVSVTGATYVSVNDGYLHVNTTPWFDGGSNTALYRGPLVGTATGTTSAPTRSLVGANSMPGPITLTQGGFQAVRGTSTNIALAGQVSGDSVNRINIDAGGVMSWSSGSASSDVSLIRSSANNLQVLTGNLSIGTVGRGIRVAEGSNAKSGTATLTAGSVVVSNTSVTANSRIQLTSNADGGTPGFLRVSARTAGTSFTITSSSGTDTSTVAYFIVEP